MRLTTARIELSAKFYEIPTSAVEKPDGVTIRLASDTGTAVYFTVKPKTWRKFKESVAAILENNPSAQWVAAAAGKMGAVDGRGIEVVNAGIQIFEKKPKPNSYQIDSI
jgi:hypothetical protein